MAQYGIRIFGWCFQMVWHINVLEGSRGSRLATGDYVAKLVGVAGIHRRLGAHAPGLMNGQHDYAVVLCEFRQRFNQMMRCKCVQTRCWLVQEENS